MNFVTKDSGDREEYKSGMRRDIRADKPRFDLLFPLKLAYSKTMMHRWAMLMARGAHKYGERNWELASGNEELYRFKESATRHLFQWLCHVDDGEDHAAAVFFNIAAAEYVRDMMASTKLPPEADFPHGIHAWLKED